MGALVDEHPRALGLDGPVAAAVCVRGLAVGDGGEVVYARELADRAGRDDLAQLLVERRIAKDITRENETLCALLGLGDVDALLPSAPDRLLEKDVVALLERLEARRVVESVGKRDDDRVRIDAGVYRGLPALPRRILRVRRELRDGVRETRYLELVGMRGGVRGVRAPADPVSEYYRPYRLHQTSISHPLR